VSTEPNALLVTLDDDLEIEKDIAKLLHNSEQLKHGRGLDQRLSAIESQIAELKSLILKKASEADADKENKRPRARFVPASWPPQLPFSDINPRISSFSESPKAIPKSRAGCVKNVSYTLDNQGLASLELRFTKKELLDYTELRLAGISKASVDAEELQNFLEQYQRRYQERKVRCTPSTSLNEVYRHLGAA
jgi:hypothetical protein